MINITLLCVQSALARTQQLVPSTIFQEQREMREVLRRRMVTGLGNMACEDKWKELCLSSLGKKYRGESQKIM